MSGKERFQKIKKQTPYISKDGKFYAIKFYVTRHFVVDGKSILFSTV